MNELATKQAARLRRRKLLLLKNGYRKQLSFYGRLTTGGGRRTEILFSAWPPAAELRALRRLLKHYRPPARWELWTCQPGLKLKLEAASI